MHFDTQELEELQKKIGAQSITDSKVSPDGIKYIAGFDVAYVGGQMVCAVAVLDFKTLTVVERKHSVGKPAMPYISGFRAFRDGPAIIQTYYDIEHEPDVLMISGHGIAHQHKCGLATYVGVELEKPTVGVAKSIVHGALQGDDVLVDNEIRGIMVRTKEHANPIIVSPGHLIALSDAAEITKHCIVHPHKLPEPLHAAHKTAKQVLSQLMNDVMNDVHKSTDSEKSELADEGDAEELLFEKMNKIVL